MPILTLTNGNLVPLVGLGRNRALTILSEKRIAKAVRQELRKQFGLQNVSVGCKAELFLDGWHGSCTIDGHNFKFKVPV